MEVISLNSKKLVKSFLNVKTDIPFSDRIEDPSVIDPRMNIKIILSEDMEKNTFKDGIKLYKVKSNGEEVEEKIIVTIDKDSSSILNLNKSDNSKFAEGEEYKLSINKKLKSMDGESLKKEYSNYFSVDYSLNLDSEGISELNNKRTLIVCISDIHLGANDSYSEITKNRDALVNFLNHIRISPNIKELIIAGDLIDEWFVPMNLDTFNGKTQRDFVKSVAFNNKSVIDAFKNIINDDKVKVTYVPGNHDILINSEDIQTILPGISEARDVKGLGAYTPDGYHDIIIEHGHRYNFYCAPDFSNQHITQTDSILPPGYFFTRMATSSVIQGRPKRDYPLPIVNKNDLGNVQYNYFLYWNVWNGLITNFPVQEGIDEKVINTNIDGFTDFYAIDDILPYQNSENNFIDLNLYKGIVETWDERQAKNLVSVKIPIAEAILKGALASHLDDQSAVQYFKNPVSNKRIVIFGHSHEARVLVSFDENQEKNVYVNSGTWIDKNMTTMTFVVIIPQKNKESAPAYVHLCQYTPMGDIKKLNSHAITNLE